jgi:integrase
MPSRPDVWWNKQRGAWCIDIGGKRRILAKGKADKKFAKDRLKELVDEQSLLEDVNGAITVAAMCDAFLEYALHNPEKRTYESYQYGCQKFVDMYAARAAHTMRPADISNFARKLETTLNPTSREIVLRTIEGCFNWAVDSQLISPHKLGRIRKPQSMQRDRYLSDKEFQILLRATNGNNGRRVGAAFRRLLLALDWSVCRPGELIRQRPAALFGCITRLAHREVNFGAIVRFLVFTKWFPKPIEDVSLAISIFFDVAPFPAARTK